MRGAWVLVFTCISGVAAAQDTLEPVRALYASADYEGALSALDRLQVTAAAIPRIDIDRYRVYCLVALGQRDEADQVIEAIVTQNPLYQPSAADDPPRIRAAFTQVRRRILPTVARRLYAVGKAAFDQKEFPEAEHTLEKTLQIIDAPETGDQPELADLRTLVIGFLELSRASIMPARIDATVLSPNAATVAARPPVVAPAPTSEPIALRQVLPHWTYGQSGALFQGEFRGAIEIDIDEGGRVVAAEIVQPIHPLYDPLLLQAARDWSYEPARRNGEPIKIRKRVDVVLQPR